MDTPTLQRLTELNDRLAIMQKELRALQGAESKLTQMPDGSINIYGQILGAEIHLAQIPNLKWKVLRFVLTEYEKEFNRLYREYDELTICKPNGKVTNYKPANLNEL